MKTLLNKILYSTIFALLLTSCEKIEPETPDIYPSARTVIVYMIADNNLYDDAIDNINQMERGWGNFNGNLLVYISPKQGNPYLLKIQHDKTPSIVSPVVKKYPSQNSCDVSVMRETFDGIMKMYPADSYGAVLWSHATGWLPAITSKSLQTKRSFSIEPGMPRIKSFGDDGGSKMNISELAQALPDSLNFILFDACLMASVESVYELKDKAEYILASSTEVLQYGFPYDEIMPSLFSPEKADLEKIAQKYFNSYDILSGVFRSATVSLIKTSEIDELAYICNSIVRNNQPVIDLNISKIQQLDTWSESLFFDFFDFMENTYPTADLTALKNQLNKVITYKNNTPKFFNDFLIKKHCGLNSFIPNLRSKYLDNAYKQTAWSKASGLSTLVTD